MNQCGDLTVKGCCDESFLYYCYNGQLGGLDCGLSGCGWSPAANAGQGGYVCGYGGEDPEGVHPQACFDCKPDCKGKQCGDNGCDGSCGSCLEGEMCGQQDLCVSACESDCADRECGMDVCGDSCGSCAEGYLCSELGKCYPEGCELDCDGRTCGDNGCGGVCGTCADGQSCDNGVCGTLGEDHGNQGDVGGELDAPGDGGCGGCASDAPAPLSLALWFLLVFGCLVLRRRQPS
jgi:MYXO-CTERM domain-containing protein